MLIAWNGETMPGLALERELGVIAQAGYGGLEVFIPKFSAYLQEHTTDELVAALTQHRLAALTMNGIENINFRSTEEFTQIRSDCRWLAETCSRIGCPTIVVVPSPAPAGADWEQIKKETVSALQDLADVAAPYGAKLAFEFLAPANCSVRTLAQGWEIVQATGRQNVGLVFDTYHFHVGGSSWQSLEEVDVGRVFIVHINDVQDLPLAQLTDGHRLLPGEGILPLNRMISRLQARGYNGAYSLEVMRPAYREREPLEYAQAGLEKTQSVVQKASTASTA